MRKPSVDGAAAVYRMFPWKEERFDSLSSDRRAAHQGLARVEHSIPTRERQVGKSLGFAVRSCVAITADQHFADRAAAPRIGRHRSGGAH